MNFEEYAVKKALGTANEIDEEQVRGVGRAIIKAREDAAKAPAEPAAKPKTSKKNDE